LSHPKSSVAEDSGAKNPIEIVLKGFIWYNYTIKSYEANILTRNLFICFFDCIKDFSVYQLISHLAVE